MVLETREVVMPEDSASTHKKAKQRSPSFPFINLEDAIDRAKQFYDQEGKAAAPPSVAVQHWGYSAKSSGGKQTLAALKAYGLLDKQGGKVQLSERALHIVVAGSPRRQEAVKEAALEPEQFRALWTRYGMNSPSEDTLKHELVLEKSFNPNAVDDFLANYRASIGYAQLAESATMSPAPEEPAETYAAPGGYMQPQARQAPTQTPSQPLVGASDEVAPFVLPLLDGNAVEFRVRRKIAPEEVEDLEAVFKVWLRKIVSRTEA